MSACCKHTIPRISADEEWYALVDDFQNAWSRHPYTGELGNVAAKMRSLATLE